MKAIFKIPLTLFALLTTFFVYPWTVTVINNSNEKIHASIHSTQSYPGGKVICWKKIFGRRVFPYPCGVPETKWCAFYHQPVEANSEKSFKYSDVAGICVAPCTKKVTIWDHTGQRELAEQSKFVGGLTACSNVKVIVGKKTDNDGRLTNNWYIFTEDWSTNFMDFFRKHIETILTAGFSFSKITEHGLALAKVAPQLKPSIQKLKTSVQGSIGFIKVIQEDISKLMDQFGKIVKIHAKAITEFGNNIDLLVKGDDEAILGLIFAEEITKAKIKPVLKEITKIRDRISQQLQTTSFREVLERSRATLKLVGSLCTHMAELGEAMPRTIISREPIGPARELSRLIDEADNKVRLLLDAKYYNIQEIMENIIKGILNTINTFDEQKLEALVETAKYAGIIIDKINILTGTLITSLQSKIDKLTPAAFGKIKDQAISVLKEPGNIALMLAASAPTIALLVGTVITLGALTPALVSTLVVNAPIILAAVQVPLRKVIKGALDSMGLIPIMSDATAITAAVTQGASAGIALVNILNSQLGIALLPQETLKIVNQFDDLLKAADTNIQKINQSLPNLVSGSTISTTTEQTTAPQQATQPQEVPNGQIVNAMSKEDMDKFEWIKARFCPDKRRCEVDMPLTLNGVHYINQRNGHWDLIWRRKNHRGGDHWRSFKNTNKEGVVVKLHNNQGTLEPQLFHKDGKSIVHWK